jgi:hypothetical protein
MQLRWLKHMTHTRKTNAPKSSVMKAEEKGPFGKVRCRWMNNIPMNLQDAEQGGVN